MDRQRAADGVRRLRRSQEPGRHAEGEMSPLHLRAIESEPESNGRATYLIDVTLTLSHN